VANIKSAKKRIKVTARRKEENRAKKSTLATAIKKFRAMVAKKELIEAEKFLPEVYSLIDSGTSHGRLHKNNASRKKARLAIMLQKANNPEVEVKTIKKVKPSKPVAEVIVKPVAEVKTVEEVKPVKKAPAKTTTTAKKPAAKKVEATEVEKAPAKKPAAKKTTATTTAKKPAAKKAA
jgi:small subunit ribosomal protein S20